MPQSIKSVEFLQENWGIGSIKQINFAEGIKSLMYFSLVHRGFKPNLLSWKFYSSSIFFLTVPLQQKQHFTMDKTLQKTFCNISNMNFKNIVKIQLC